MGRQRGGRREPPGFRHRHQREPGPDGLVQGEHDGERLPHRPLPSRLLPGQRGAARRLHSEHLDREDQSARLPDEQHRPRRLRQLVRVRLVGCSLDRGLRHLHRQASGRSRRDRREPHGLRRPPGRRDLRRVLPDLRHHLARLQPLRREQPLRGHGARDRPVRRGPRLQGQLQPPVQHAGDRARGLALQHRVPDGPVAGEERLRRQLHHGSRHGSPRQRAPQPQGLPVRRPRRVLVRPAAREHRGGSRPHAARAPRLLQRQRDLLEDAVGVEHRRHRHHLPHARLLQGDARGRQDRPFGRVDGHLARPEVLAAVRRRPARERPRRHDLHGQRRAQRQLRGPGGGREDALLAQHPERRQPHRRPGLVGADRHARVRVGRGPRQRLPSRGTRTALDDDDQRHDRRRAGLRVDLRAGPGHAPPGVPQAVERRSRVRRRHHPVALGARQRARPGQRRPERRHAAGHGEPLRRHGRAARHAPGGAPSGLGLRRRRRARLRHHLPGERRHRPGRHPGDHPGDGDRRAARPGGRGRGVGGWRRDLAPRGRTRELVLRLDAPGQRLPHPPLPRRGRQRQPRDARPREDGHRQRPASAVGRREHLGGRRQPECDEPERRTADRVRRPLPLVARGLDHPPPLLQGHPGQRHPRGPSLERHGNAPGHGHLRRRDGVRLAGGGARRARRDHGEHHLRRVLLLVGGLLHDDGGVLRSGDHQLPLDRPRGRNRRRERSLQVRGARVPHAVLHADQLLGGRRLQRQPAGTGHDAAHRGGDGPVERRLGEASSART